MITALLVAAGQGLRMGTAQRKQFLSLAGRPLLAHTIHAFDACAAVQQIVLVLPETEFEFCHEQILSFMKISKPVTLVAGGPLRQDSVFNGLQSIPQKDSIVLIHDGVRPLISADLIEACIAGAKQWGACIPAGAAIDTPKQINANGIIVQTIDRDLLCMAQTPQAFSSSIIQEAHALARKKGWQATDDASLVERMGTDVHVIPGSRDNIKITTPQDLAWAEVFLRRRQEKR